jgi:hypothetical protein
MNDHSVCNLITHKINSTSNRLKAVFKYVKKTNFYLGRHFAIEGLRRYELDEL